MTLKLRDLALCYLKYSIKVVFLPKFFVKPIINISVELLIVCAQEASWLFKFGNTRHVGANVAIKILLKLHSIFYSTIYTPPIT